MWWVSFNHNPVKTDETDEPGCVVDTVRPGNKAGDPREVVQGPGDLPRHF